MLKGVNTFYNKIYPHLGCLVVSGRNTSQTYPFYPSYSKEYWGKIASWSVVAIFAHSEQTNQFCVFISVINLDVTFCR